MYTRAVRPAPAHERARPKPTMLVSGIENLLNRGLPRSPRARALCAELAGTRIAIEVRGFGTLLLECDGQRLRLTPGGGAPGGTIEAPVRISGGPISLAGLAGTEVAAAMRRGNIAVSGDTALAEKMRELLELLNPDLEEELALAVGDVPAHQLGRLARAAVAWTQRAADTAVRNVGEFLAHERRDLVSRAEGRQFLEGVDTLREDIDRLEVRTAHAAAQLAARRGERSGA
jgi:ubiquinone biosynthesis accessory factor UbiJ